MGFDPFDPARGEQEAWLNELCDLTRQSDERKAHLKRLEDELRELKRQAEERGQKSPGRLQVLGEGEYLLELHLDPERRRVIVDLPGLGYALGMSSRHARDVAAALLSHAARLEPHPNPSAPGSGPGLRPC